MGLKANKKDNKEENCIEKEEKELIDVTKWVCIKQEKTVFWYNPVIIASLFPTLRCVS